MKNKIFQLIQDSIISLEQVDLEELYRYWRSEEKDKKDARDNNFKKWIQNKSLISSCQHAPNDSILNGIDLPFWYENSNPKRRIMIVGIDPLRNKKSFEECDASISEDVIIGTPYAVHSSKMKIWRTKQYWEFIETLMNENLVYLTDIFKLYFVSNEYKIRSYNFFSKFHRKDSLSVLKREIDIVNPDVIVTLGKLSFELLAGINLKSIVKDINETVFIDQEFNDIPIVPLVHLSGTVRKSQKVKFLKENGISEDANFGKSYVLLLNIFFEKQNL